MPVDIWVQKWGVDIWPFYSDAERQLVRSSQASAPAASDRQKLGWSFPFCSASLSRKSLGTRNVTAKYSAATTDSPSDSLYLKRPLSTSAAASTKQIETPPKKAKLSHSTPPPSHSNQQPLPSSQPPLDAPFMAPTSAPHRSALYPPPDAPFMPPTSAPHRPAPHPLHTSTFVQQQQTQKPWTSNPSVRQPIPALSVSAPQPSPAVVKTPAIPTPASQPPSTHHRPSQSLYTSFVPASSATVTNGLTTSSTSSAGSTSLNSLTLPAAGVQESLKQPVRPVQPAQQDERVKPEGGEKKRKDKKKEKKKKKEKDKERSQDKRSASKDPSSVEHGSSGGNHGDQETTHKNGQKGEKQKQLQEAIVEQPTCTDASSTSNIPDYISQFPPIESEKQRSEYKRVFNEEYVEYLRIKECMDAVKEECAVLSERMSQVPKNSGEAKEVRKKIKEKYTELKENKHQQRFQELHFKLSHIKQLVVDYDKNQPLPSLSVQ